MAKTELVIGSRGSQLALWQSNHIKILLENTLQDIVCSVITIKTQGDQDQSIPLPNVGDKGFFTAEIESELRNRNIDLAVHSLKDLPVKLSNEFVIAAIPNRDSPFDVLIHNDLNSVDSLPQKAAVATSSIRRKVQLMNLRKDLQLVDVRGNVSTRIDKFNKNKWDGLIMAEAAINRLNLKNLNYTSLTLDQMIPAAGQGAIAVQILKERTDLHKQLICINHPDTFFETQLERSFVDQLGGGCQHPIAAYARFEKSQIKMDTMVASLDGEQIIRVCKKHSLVNPENIVDEVLTEMKQNGGVNLLKYSQEYSNA